MEISKHHLYKNLHIIAIDQIGDFYSQKGYKVEKEKRIGKFIADLVVSNEKEKIIFEIKTGKMSSDERAKLAGLADYVNSLGDYKFQIVFARPPKEKKIEIPELEGLLMEYVFGNIFDEVDIMSTHSIIKSVYFIEVHEIELIQVNEINVIGEGLVDVDLQYGSERERKEEGGGVMNESFPFTFNITLQYNKNKILEIGNITQFEIDTSSFYGD